MIGENFFFRLANFNSWVQKISNEWRTNIVKANSWKYILDKCFLDEERKKPFRRTKVFIPGLFN